jgi:regulatory protein
VLITKITSYRSSVLIYLDEEPTTPLPLDTALKFNLTKNQNLTPPQISKTFSHGLILKLTRDALNYNSFRPRSEKEIYLYLHKKLTTILQKLKPNKINQAYIEPFIIHSKGTLINQTINKLKNKNYINDEDFAKWWFESRTKQKKYGPQKIAAELKAKGVSEVLIRKYQSRYQPSQDTIKVLLTKTAQALSHKKLTKYQFKQKLLTRCFQRGFSGSALKKQIDVFVSREYNDLR